MADKTLLVLRHAKSSWKEPSQSDYERPLNKRGLKTAPRIGRLLAEENLAPDIILSSSAARARRTTELVVEQCGGAEIHYLDTFYLAAASVYIEQLQLLDDAYSRPLVVGHNPGLERLVFILAGCTQSLPTAALVHIGLEAPTWRDLRPTQQGELLNLWLPRELDE